MCSIFIVVLWTMCISSKLFCCVFYCRHHFNVQLTPTPWWMVYDAIHVTVCHYGGLWTIWTETSVPMYLCLVWECSTMLTKSIAHSLRANISCRDANEILFYYKNISIHLGLLESNSTERKREKVLKNAGRIWCKQRIKS